MSAAKRTPTPLGQWYWIAANDDMNTAREVSPSWVRSNLRQSGYTVREARVAMQVCRNVEALVCTVKGGSYQFKAAKVEA